MRESSHYLAENDQKWTRTAQKNVSISYIISMLKQPKVDLHRLNKILTRKPYAKPR